jgi:hypothetical protein
MEFDPYKYVHAGTTPVTVHPWMPDNLLYLMQVSVNGGVLCNVSAASSFALVDSSLVRYPLNL